MGELAGKRSLVRRRMAGSTMLIAGAPDREAEAGNAGLMVSRRLVFGHLVSAMWR